MLSLQKNKQMKKYSDWFKVDLHIHTDWSKKTKTNDYQGNFDSYEEAREALVKALIQTYKQEQLK